MPQYQSAMISFSHSMSAKRSDGYSLHCHPVFEIYYFVCGDVDYLVEGVHYHPTAHSLLLLSPGTFHGFRCNTAAPYERYSLHFDRQALREDVSDTLLSPFFATGIYVRAAQPYLPYLRGLEACAHLPKDAADACASAHMLALLGLLRAALGTRESSDANAQSATLSQQVIAYLSLNLSKPNTLESLARRFFVSRSQLSRAFVQETGASVAEYIRRKRLIYADHLRRQGMSATQAALKAGFGDYSTYYRTLRREESRSEGETRAAP